MREPRFTVGIEEEYLLVDPTSRDLISDAPPGMLKECERRLHEQVTPEFLQSQIEVGTRPHTSLTEAREELAHLRRTVSEVAREHDVALMAASTHPFAIWDRQRRTPRERYADLERDLQAVVRRLMISGMHVHVEIDDEDLRIDLMNQATYILPHLLALSTSSPFWQGELTGLNSYRVAVWNELPRTGLPEQFASYGEYDRHVKVLIDAGLIEDSTKLWWDIRPSHKFPTIEMRISDVCTHVDDGVCIAALYRCWLRMLFRLRGSNQRWRTYVPMLVSENRWRAQRYGIDKGLVDFGRGEVVPFDELIEEFIELLMEDAEYFDCVTELEHARDILKNGTSAHWQTRCYHQAIESGLDQDQALKSVVDLLVTETMSGIEG
ncbi:MAG: carboxylate-amine ligase [Pseudomonadota bacterium]